MTFIVLLLSLFSVNETYALGEPCADPCVHVEDPTIENSSSMGAPVPAERAAAMGVHVDDNAIVQIYRSTVSNACKRVTTGNVTEGGLLVPTNTSAEWTAFASFTPANVTISNCSCYTPNRVHGASGFSSTTYTTNLPVGAACTTVDIFSDRYCSHGYYGSWSPVQGGFTFCDDGCVGSPNVAHGGSNARTRWLTNAPIGDICTNYDEIQNRSCSDGSWGGWSGTYTFSSCLSGCAGSPNVANGGSNSRTRYSTNVPLNLCTAVDEIQSRNCSDGSWGGWSGTFTFSGCNDGCGTHTHGQSQNRTRYSTNAPVGAACTTVDEVQSRTCSNGGFGGWSGSFTFSSCNNGCTSPSRAHGGTDSRTRYSTSTPLGACTTVDESQSRTCSNGAFGGWSGSFTNSTCNDGCGTHAHGGSNSRTRYQFANHATCPSEVQNNTCSNGSFGGWSGTYTFSSCATCWSGGGTPGPAAIGECCAGTPNLCSFDSPGAKLLCPGGEACYCTALGCIGGPSPSPAAPAAPAATCFVAGTAISTKDGRGIPIEDIKVGDKILGPDGEVEVTRIYTHDQLNKIFSFNKNGKYFITESHPIRTTEGWKSFNPDKAQKEGHGIKTTKLEVGDILVKENGEKELLMSVDYKLSTERVYNITVSGDHIYYADEYEVHNKCTPMSCSGGTPLYSCDYCGGFNNVTCKCNDGTSEYCDNTTPNCI